MTSINVALPALVLSSAILLAQGAAPAAFDAATVRHSGSPDAGLRVAWEQGGRFVSRNGTVRMLIRAAYEVRDVQIVDLPGWASSERFDIAATAGRNASSAEMRPMLRTLLAERFALRVHLETRALPIYALTLAREDRALGPRLMPSRGDCRERRTCGMQSGGSGTLRTLRGGDVGMAQLANSLVYLVADRMVIDRTGLAGLFDVDLQWTPDELLTTDSPVPALITALQEQLGLKLDPARGPVDVLVIDAVARPTPD